MTDIDSTLYLVTVDGTPSDLYATEDAARSFIVNHRVHGRSAAIYPLEPGDYGGDLLATADAVLEYWDEDDPDAWGVGRDEDD